MQLSCSFAGHPSDILKILRLPHTAEFASNPACFKANSVIRYVPLKVIYAVEMNVTQSLIFSPQTFMSLRVL